MTTRFLHGQVAWVSGASRGVGRAIATALARAGATVCIGARSLDALQQLAALLNGEGGTAHAVPLDLRSPESIAAFAELALQLAGPPTILVNNAGLGVFKDIELLDPADFEEQIAVNLRGPWYLTRAVVPHLRRQGSGHIINISSIAGRVAFRRGTGYCAAKAGLNAMSESLMYELRDSGIKVTVIAPGSIASGFHQHALPSGHHNEQDWMLEPSTIADAVLHILTQPPDVLTNYYEVRPLQPGK